MTPTAATGAYAAAKTLMQAGALAGTAGPTTAGLAATSNGQGFGQLLQGALNGAADAGRRAEAEAMAAASGKANLVDVVTAVAESETALQTLVAVRDRMISAYEEIMRMPI